MRSFKRRTFVMHHDGHRLEAAGAAAGFETFTPAGGSGGGRPTLLVPPAPPPQQDVEPAPEKAAHPLACAAPPKPRRNWTVATSAAEPPANRDAVLAERIVGLVQELNQTMNDAVQSGLIVEPVLSRVKSRYSSRDDEGIFVLSMKLFRKLC